MIREKLATLPAPTKSQQKFIDSPAQLAVAYGDRRSGKTYALWMDYAEQLKKNATFKAAMTTPIPGLLKHWQEVAKDFGFDDMGFIPWGNYERFMGLGLDRLYIDQADVATTSELDHVVWAVRCPVRTTCDFGLTGKFKQWKMYELPEQV